MMALKQGDSQANLAAVLVTEAAAGTQAYARFAFPYSVMDKVGLIISRIEYWFLNQDKLTSDNDRISMGLIAGNEITDVTDQTNPLLVDNARITFTLRGAGASHAWMSQPLMKDFANLPGGGIMVAPAPLSACILSEGATGVCSGYLKLFYTYKQLSPEDYWQLVESRRIIST